VIKVRSTLVKLIISVVVSYAINSEIIVLMGVNPNVVYQRIWQGSLSNVSSFSNTLNIAIPLILVSMGLLFTSRSGQWNIGIEGQMMMGAVFAAFAARTFVLPSFFQIPIEIFIAMIGGAIWAGFQVGSRCLESMKFSVVLL